MPTEPTDVSTKPLTFVSHSSKDKLVANAICARLENQGIRCWIAPRDVDPGRDYSDQIAEALENSATILAPKSLLTWMIDRRLNPISRAYLPAATPWRASVVIVRKNQPPDFPSRPRLVRVGEDEAGEIWTTPAGAVPIYGAINSERLPRYERLDGPGQLALRCVVG